VPCATTNITVLPRPKAPVAPLSAWIIFPGGQSFSLAARPGDIKQIPWMVNLPPSSQLLIAVGDESGPLSGGVSTATIEDGVDQSCINSSSPHVTPTPAGQIAPSSGSSVLGSIGKGIGISLAVLFVLAFCSGCFVKQRARSQVVVTTATVVTY
jgi:hypothetical protein